jgi:hypothetical protein
VVGRLKDLRWQGSLKSPGITPDITLKLTPHIQSKFHATNKTIHHCKSCAQFPKFHWPCLYLMVTSRQDVNSLFLLVSRNIFFLLRNICETGIWNERVCVSMIFAAVRTGSLEIDLCDACSELSDSGFRGEREKRARRKKNLKLARKNSLLWMNSFKISKTNIRIGLEVQARGCCFVNGKLREKISGFQLVVSLSLGHQNRFYLSSTNQ